MFNLGYAVVTWLTGFLVVVKVVPKIIEYMERTTQESNYRAEARERNGRRCVEKVTVTRIVTVGGKHAR